MPVLQIKDGNGKFIPINALKGDEGKSAYDLAKEGGYKGTEAEFAELLAGIGTLGNVGTHIADTIKHITAEERTAWNGKADASHSHTISQITEFPSAMPASDVYSWAKQPNKPSYTASEVGLGDVNVGVSTGAISGTFIEIGKNAQVKDDNSLHARDGVAIGGSATADICGVAIGDLATATGNSCIAIGAQASATSNLATSAMAIGIGANSSGGNSIAIGRDASTSGAHNIAIGEDAIASGNWAIQLGAGTNDGSAALKVYGDVLLGLNGKIPSERLPIVKGSYSGSGSATNQTIQVGGTGNVLLITSSNNDIAFAYASGAHSYPNNGSDFSVKESNAKFANGVLTLTNNSYAGLNASGITYYYQVL